MEENRHFYHGYTLIASRMMAGAANAALAEPDASYTTTMRLRDGMQGTYAVNEPAATPVSGAQTQTLTASERNEAEIAATAILRRNAGKECLPTPCDGAAGSVLVIVPATGVRVVRCWRRGSNLTGADRSGRRHIAS